MRKSVKIKASQNKVWAKISNIVGLPSWVTQVKKTVFLSKKKRGIGAVRKITFDDGNVVVEHVILWENKKAFSYIATSGLPLQTYVATFTIQPIKRNLVNVTWQSYFITKKVTRKQFSEFQTFMGIFYFSSLKSLKKILEE